MPTTAWTMPDVIMVPKDAKVEDVKAFSIYESYADRIKDVPTDKSIKVLS